MSKVINGRYAAKTAANVIRRRCRDTEKRMSIGAAPPTAGSKVPLRHASES